MQHLLRAYMVHATILDLSCAFKQMEALLAKNTRIELTRVFDKTRGLFQ